MAVRTATASWSGDLAGGKGRIAFGNGRFEQEYAAAARFDEENGTNPEELIAGAHAGCFSMALAHMLAEEGHPPSSVHTEARVHLKPDDGGFTITTIELETDVQVPGLDEAAFQETAEKAKAGCPVSKALAGPEITLTARLI
jgi:osmotically inducible protein OsmC